MTLAELLREGLSELRLERRQGVERALELLGRRRDAPLVVLRAPTGYGKSTASVALGYAVYRAYKRGEHAALQGLAKVIHVLPMASIVEDLYRRALETLAGGGCRHRPGGRCLQRLEYTLAAKYEERWVGYQAWSVDADFKDPLYIYSTLVYTTFDSFVLNLYKITPMAARRAPYEAARAAVMRGFVFLDEAHLLAESAGDREGPWKTFTALKAAAASLVELKTPVVVATATIPSGLARLIAPHAPAVTVVAKGCGYGPGGGEEEVVEDYEPKGVVTARLAEEVNYVDLARSYGGLRLFVFNTVRRALGVYLKLREELGEERTVLLHGRLSLGDRAEALEKLRSLQREGGVVVATQVVEAGVDLDASLLVTDVAPLPSLIQRLGRAARRQVKAAEAYIVKDAEAVKSAASVYGEAEVELTLGLLGRRAGPDGVLDVDWRYPCPSREGSYAALLERFGEVYGEAKIDEELFASLASLNSLVVKHRDEAQRLLERFCGFVRESAAVPVVTSLNCVKGGDLRRCVVMVSLDFLLRERGGEPLYQRILERRGDAYLAVVRGEANCGEEAADGVYLCGVRLDFRDVSRACRDVLRLESKVAADVGGEKGRAVIYGLLARGDAYLEGLGFKAEYE